MCTSIVCSGSRLCNVFSASVVACIDWCISWGPGTVRVIRTIYRTRGCGPSLCLSQVGFLITSVISTICTSIVCSGSRLCNVFSASVVACIDWCISWGPGLPLVIRTIFLFSTVPFETFETRCTIVTVHTSLIIFSETSTIISVSFSICFTIIIPSFLSLLLYLLGCSLGYVVSTCLMNIQIFTGWIPITPLMMCAVYGCCTIFTQYTRNVFHRRRVEPVNTLCITITRGPLQVVGVCWVI